MGISKFKKIKEEVAGKRCFIVGAGPSLDGFDFSLLEGEVTIGLNFMSVFFEPTIHG